MKSSTTNYKLISQRVIAVAFVAASLLGSVSFINQGQANAASGAPFAQAYVRLDRLAAVTVTGGRVCIKPSTANQAQTIASVKITFPTTGGTDYLVSATVGNWAT
ncbi:MAG: hypothetical protein JWO41_918, partial [Candidatus Saccharibacteria bacterium]|nr:hypothetical protein [Candidatus Saccharibacteria bacterium]